jgi:CRP-like cAMP-binding protein
VEEEVGRGETIGAVWAVTSGKHDTSAVATRGCELVRLSRGSFEARSAAAVVCTEHVLRCEDAEPLLERPNALVCCIARLMEFALQSHANEA